MASLKFREKNVLEDFFEMRSGFVLNFSDKTFAEFFRDFNVDIDSAGYREGHSGSKANRMRTFWDRDSDGLVSDVLLELIDYAESYRPSHPAAEACRAIANRLRDTARVAPAVPATEPLHVKSGPIEIFFSYAHEDEELMDQVRLQLVVRERLGQIVKWHDRKIPPGDEWRSHVDHRIEHADVILLFMSPHFLDSRYCYEIEGGVALRRHAEGKARVIPVILRACDWEITPFAKLQALPKDGRPFNQWPDADQAALDIARGIMQSIVVAG